MDCVVQFCKPTKIKYNYILGLMVRMSKKCGNCGYLKISEILKTNSVATEKFITWIMGKTLLLVHPRK